MRSIHISELKKEMVIVEDGVVLVCMTDAYRVNTPDAGRVGWECVVVDTDTLRVIDEELVHGQVRTIFEADKTYGFGLDIYRVR